MNHQLIEVNKLSKSPLNVRWTVAKGMPETLKRDLEAYRLQVAQAEIARHPAIAFDLLVFHAANGILGHSTPSDGPAVHFTQQYLPTSIQAEKTLAHSILVAIRNQLPKEWTSSRDNAVRFEAFRGLPDADKQAILAYCVASTLRPKLAPPADHPGSAYDAALSHTGVDVASHWRPTAANYLGRITRDQLLALGREVLGEEWAQLRHSDKKGHLAEQLGRAFAEPEKHARNAEQLEKLTHWLPEGMAFTAAAPKQPKAKKNARKAA
jgi:ParB family chromosome partitioning protein